MLDVARPTLIRMLETGEIPYHRTGNRRKLRDTEVMAYRDRIRAARMSALDELAARDRELGCGYQWAHTIRLFWTPAFCLLPRCAGKEKKQPSVPARLFRW